MTQRPHSTLQPGRRRCCGGVPWLDVAECCCLFNCLYAFDDEADLDAAADGDSSSELLLANSSHSATIIDPNVPLSTREADEVFAFPANFDPLWAYYDLYEHLGGSQADTAASSSSPRESPRVTEEAVVEAIKQLGAHEGSAADVQRCFTLLMLGIRGTEKGSEKREQYIRQCHYYRDLYCRDDPHDAQQAEVYAREVASEESRARNRKHMNLLYYQKGIYFTHRSAAKLQLQKEYRAYCESLGWHPPVY